VDDFLLENLNLEGLKNLTRQDMYGGSTVALDYTTYPGAKELVASYCDGSQKNWNILMLTGLTSLVLARASQYYGENGLTNGVREFTPEEVGYSSAKLNSLILEDPSNHGKNLENQQLTPRALMSFIQFVQEEFLLKEILY